MHEKKSKVFIVLFFLFISFAFTSCVSINGRRFANLSFPIGIRAKKKKIKPPLEFIEAIFYYKDEYGLWPVSKKSFEVQPNNRQAIEKLYRSGFITYSLGECSADSLTVYFVHEPVYIQTISFFAIPGQKVKLATTFYSNRFHKTELKK